MTTPTTVIAVRGTEFGVIVKGNKTKVYVREGEVGVSNLLGAIQEVILDPGQFTEIERDRPPLPPDRFDPDKNDDYFKPSDRDERHRDDDPNQNHDDPNRNQPPDNNNPPVRNRDDFPGQPPSNPPPNNPLPGKPPLYESFGFYIFRPKISWQKNI